MKKIPDNQIAFYQSPDGSVNIEVMFAQENIWLTQKKIAELFDTTPQNITQHLKNIYEEKEIEQEATCKDFLQVQTEGSREVERNLTMYSLEAVIAIGYRVNSDRGTQFRQWATGILKNYIHKGYALDSNRMKYGSRFSARYFDELYEEIKDIRISGTESDKALYNVITGDQIMDNFFNYIRSKMRIARDSIFNFILISAAVHYFVYARVADSYPLKHDLLVFISCAGIFLAVLSFLSLRDSTNSYFKKLHNFYMELKRKNEPSLIIKK